MPDKSKNLSQILKFKMKVILSFDKVSQNLLSLNYENLIIIISNCLLLNYFKLEIIFIFLFQASLISSWIIFNA